MFVGMQYMGEGDVGWCRRRDARRVTRRDARRVYALRLNACPSGNIHSHSCCF